MNRSARRYGLPGLPGVLGGVAKLPGTSFVGGLMPGGGVTDSGGGEFVAGTWGEGMSGGASLETWAGGSFMGDCTGALSGAGGFTSCSTIAGPTPGPGFRSRPGLLGVGETTITRPFGSSSSFATGGAFG